MKFDKYFLAIIFGLLGIISLILMFVINIDYVGGPFALLTIIFTLAALIALFYPKKK